MTRFPPPFIATLLARPVSQSEGYLLALAIEQDESTVRVARVLRSMVARRCTLDPNPNAGAE